MTPFDLAVKVIKGMSPKLFGKSLLIPGSGYGTLAIAAVHCGWDPAMITCVEISAANVLISSAYLKKYGIKVVHHDFTTWKPNMHFKSVIANPPYQDNDNKAKEQQIVDEVR